MKVFEAEETNHVHKIFIKTGSTCAVVDKRSFNKDGIRRCLREVARFGGKLSKGKFG